MTLPQPGLSFAGFLIIFDTTNITQFAAFRWTAHKILIEYDLDVVAGVPVAVIIKAVGLFEDARQLFAARAHVVNVSRSGFVAVVKPPLLARLRPENFVVAVGIERRVNVN